jgi:hypothetical protein
MRGGEINISPQSTLRARRKDKIFTAGDAESAGNAGKTKNVIVFGAEPIAGRQILQSYSSDFDLPVLQIVIFPAFPAPSASPAVKGFAFGFSFAPLASFAVKIFLPELWKIPPARPAYNQTSHELPGFSAKIPAAALFRGDRAGACDPHAEECH